MRNDGRLQSPRKGLGGRYSMARRCAVREPSPTEEYKMSYTDTEALSLAVL